MELPSERPQLLPPENKEYDSKIVIITGGASGIGRATVDAFSGKGAHVIVIDIAERPSDIPEAGYRQVDVSRWNEVEAAVNAVAEEFGGIDYVVNNAAMKVSGTILEVSSETFGRMLDVNAKGFWNVAKATLPHLLKSHGTLIDVCSGTSEDLPPDTDAYFGSKGATYSLTHSLASTFRDKGVTIRGIAPGPVDTPLWREGKSDETIKLMLAGKRGPKVESPSAIADTILSLASKNNPNFNGKILRL